ncbi:hypothetical protein PINS_up022287 [Pythium insidiosum]|nr:hypothetical protein PINS_up022287 [Pythium insidiosum]
MTSAAPASSPPTAPPAAPQSAASNAASSTVSPPPSDVAQVLAPPSQDPIAKTVVVPRCSTWFAMDKINPIEKRMLPEFFVNEEMHRNIPPGAKLPSSKTPQIYMKYRNYMVQAYRQQPHVYLTATACRRNLAGDACAIMRVHEFLTHWGLINYNVPPHAMPPTTHPNYSLKPAVVSNAPSSNSNDPLAVLTSQRAAAGHSLSGGSGDKQLCELCGSNPVSFELSSDAKRKFGVVTSAPGQVVMPGTIKDMPLGAFCVRPGSGICDDCYLRSLISRRCGRDGFHARRSARNVVKGGRRTAH